MMERSNRSRKSRRQEVSEDILERELKQYVNSSERMHESDAVERSPKRRKGSHREVDIETTVHTTVHYDEKEEVNGSDLNDDEQRRAIEGAASEDETHAVEGEHEDEDERENHVNDHDDNRDPNVDDELHRADADHQEHDEEDRDEDQHQHQHQEQEQEQEQGHEPEHEQEQEAEHEQEPEQEQVQEPEEEHGHEHDHEENMESIREIANDSGDAAAAVSTIRIHYQDLSGNFRGDTTINVGPENPELYASLSSRSDVKTENKKKRGKQTKGDESIQDWRKIRKESHKEVERRRRETINLAIDNLRKLLPKPEYSKAGILNSAAALIQKLKESESSQMNKWAIQRIVTEQTKTAHQKSNEKLAAALDDAYQELTRLKSILKENNIKYEDKFVIPEDTLREAKELESELNRAQEEIDQIDPRASAEPEEEEEERDEEAGEDESKE
ncbi:Centromere-binding protein 1 [Nakaseomyces glabratus]|uniref:Centromere-binding protein 1 n=1 Tax=Candida glabrata TaxID=5478 RepID=A0A0W0C827_CANGB|nr:Centromere-binding protein 1 [Nakaseomyces glabratus]KTA98982.1 Centromere-binding protein 1 [Nakaseomyces glabratus]